MTSRRSPWLMLLVLFLAACGIQPPAPPSPPSLLSPWSYADLRLLDPADADLPSHDLVAVYLRRSGDDLQLRLDLLADVDRLDYDLYLALQAGPSGAHLLPIQALAGLAWDTLLVIPAAGPLQVLTSAGASRPAAALSVFRDPVNDTLLISLPLSTLLPGYAFSPAASPLQLQVFLTPAGSTFLADETSILRSNAPPPSPANLLLAFWDVYPAYTPATALRRWDGAHTGPLGGRHGLYNLLRTAQAAGVPLVLLDLKDPASLSALDYAGGLELVRQMVQSGLLILPEPLLDPRFGPFDLPSPIQDTLLASSKAVSHFGLPASQFLYLPPFVPAPQTGRSLLFARLPPPESPASASPLALLRWQGRTVIPLPAQPASAGAFSPSPQLDPDGITLDWRRRLLATAIYANQPGNSPENTFLWLGGDLPASAWGDPQSARAAFRWLVAHPWVHFLDRNALLGARPTQPAPLSSSAADPGATHFPSAWHLSGEAFPPASPALTELLPPPPTLLASLQAAPANPLTQAAWQLYRSLYAPVYPAPPQLCALRQAYTGQLWSLLRAADWAESPSPLSNCDLDPDHDGQPECLLASERFYAQFEIADGSLTYLFAAYRRQDLPAGWLDTIHQLVGPSSQFITGLSSPDTWHLDPGQPGSALASSLSTDPSVIPGAFAGPGSGFTPSLDHSHLLFTSPGGQAIKTFRLDETGLQVAYRLPSNATYPAAQIPLALDPWRRFTSGWAGLYRAWSSPNTWIWQLESGPQVLVRTSSALIGGDFSQSRSLFSAAEDPNRDFPLGHFAPFPLAVLQVSLSETTQISIQVLPQP